jgi:hypothetical protein
LSCFVWFWCASPISVFCWDACPGKGEYESIRTHTKEAKTRPK